MKQTWIRRCFSSVTAATLTGSRVSAVETPSAPLVYIGSMTHDLGNGIHVARWNARSGTLSGVRLAFEAVSPSFLVVSRHRKARLLFAGYQTSREVGGLSSFRMEPSGDLKLLNTLPAPGADFAHLALDHTEQCLIAPNYGRGTILSCKVDTDGHLTGFVSQIQLTGRGPIVSRQTAPHPHGVAISPNNQFIYINDLGTDRILIYKLNAATAMLTPGSPPFYTAAPGSGPRHLAFHPNGQWAYSINDLDSTITLLQWNATSGALIAVANVPTMLPGGDVANNRAGEIAFDVAGHFLYACNRGAAEELVTFSVGPSGHLNLIGRIQVEGKEARHFTVSPDDGYLFVAEQFSNEVAVFARDRRTGLLTPVDARYSVDSASCVVFG